MDHRLFFLQKNGWCLSPKFQSNGFGSSKGLKERFLYSFGQKTARVPWQNSFNLMLILKCQWQICLICTNIKEIKFHLVIIVHLVYLFLPFLSRVKLNFLSIDWIQWSLWFPMNIQGLFYHFTITVFLVCKSRRKIYWSDSPDLQGWLIPQKILYCFFCCDPKFLLGIERLFSCLMETHLAYQ